jgi:hypothetical protein
MEKPPVVYHTRTRFGGFSLVSPIDSLCDTIGNDRKQIVVAIIILDDDPIVTYFLGYLAIVSYQPIADSEKFAPSHSCCPQERSPVGLSLYLMCSL